MAGDLSGSKLWVREVIKVDLILSLSKDEVVAGCGSGGTPSWFDKLTMRSTETGIGNAISILVKPAIAHGDGLGPLAQSFE